jgi:hypothetical protein
MTTIEMTVDIGPNRQLAIQLPEDITPGRHRVVLQIEEARPAKQPDIVASLPRFDVGPWPEGFTVRREDIYGDDGR